PFSLLRRAPRVQVHDGGEPLAVLDREATCQDLHVVDELGGEEPAEKSADRVGEWNSVELVLDVGMVAAGKQVPERVVDESGLRGEDLVDGLRVAARQLFDLLVLERRSGRGRVGGCRRQWAVPLDYHLLLGGRPQREGDA